jgi:zinc protease
MQSEPLGEEDLHRARALLIKNIPLSESSVDSIAQKYISLVDLDLPLDEPTRAAQNYLKLKAEDVQAAFQKWIRPHDFVQVTQGPNPM